MSEEPTFPVDPSLELIENCRKRVDEHADVLVLIVGTRHGHTDPTSDKSITNLEYMTARAEQIPIYAFFDQSLLALLPIWEANPTVDFSKTVDDPRFFGFVKQVRATDGVWSYSFEKAEDIVEILRTQLAFLSFGSTLGLATCAHATK